MKELGNLVRKYGEYLALGGVACLAAALVRFMVGGEFNTYVQALLAVGVVLLAMYALGRPREITGALTGRRARYGSNMLLMTAAFIGILVLLNFLGGRYEKRLDWTQDKAFSVSDQTRKILANLDKPIKITGFFTQEYAGQKDQVQTLLKEYGQHTKLLSSEFIDPEVQPSVARQFGITADGTLVFQSEGRTQTTAGSDEQALTSAILRVSQAEQKVVYFLVGHGERASDGFAQSGYSQAKQVLEADNYLVKTTNLSITPTVPADAAVLIVASPTKALMDPEIAAIRTYLNRGGKLLYLTDPQATTGMETTILAGAGITVNNDIVIDPASALLGDVGSPLISNFRWSNITKDLTAQAYFPWTRSFGVSAAPPAGVTLTPFADTSTSSWSETDLTNSQVTYDPAKDAKGPVTVGVAAEMRHEAAGVTLAPAGRLVAFGDADFASNAALAYYGNKDLFANSVNWLTEEESLISIRAKPPTRHTLFMTASEKTLGMVSSVVLLPLAVLLAGAVVWWRRR